MRVLGIDPGFGLCGFAVVSSSSKKLVLESFGVIKTKTQKDFPSRLKEIGDDLEQIFKKYKPDIVSIEDLFFVQNISTGIRVAQVRGVVLFLAQKFGCVVLEPRPTELKRSFTGNGKATKKDIRKMAQILFHLKDIPQVDDSADAIAAAYFGCIQKSLVFVKK